MSETASATVGLGPDHGYGPDIHHVLLSEEQIQNYNREPPQLPASDRRRLLSLKQSGADCTL